MWPMTWWSRSPKATPARSGPTPERSGLVLPPLGQPSSGLLLAQRPLLEPELEQMGQGPADVAPRRQTELIHHLGPVEVGADGVQLLLLAQLGDTRLELVHAPAERSRLVGVAGGAVTAGQLVEPVEQRADVAHVAADGTVGPSQPVGVEAQMEVD